MQSTMTNKTANSITLFIDEYPDQRDIIKKISKQQYGKNNSDEFLGYLNPVKGGGVYNGIHYTGHALERMAPSTPQTRELLLQRAYEKMESAFLKLKANSVSGKVNSTWWKEFVTNPRGILPIDVESAIKYPHASDLTVKMESNRVITVYRTSCSSENSNIKEMIDKIKSKAKKLQNKHRGKTISDRVEIQRNSVIERRAHYVRRKTLELHSQAEQWEVDYKQSRNKKQINIVQSNKEEKELLKKIAKYQKLIDTITKQRASLLRQLNLKECEVESYLEANLKDKGDVDSDENSTSVEEASLSENEEEMDEVDDDDSDDECDDGSECVDEVAMFVQTH